MTAELFRPFKALNNLLCFEEDGQIRQWVAKIGEDDVIAYAGFASVAHPEALKDWKADVRKRLLGESSTVVLRTACGCERLLDLSHKSELRSYFVPLMWTGSAIEYLRDSPIPESFTYHQREFKWDRRYHENGARVLEERIIR